MINKGDASFQVLNVTADEGAWTYGSGAYDFATGATGNVGIYNAIATASGWHSVKFLQGVSTSALPTGLHDLNGIFFSTGYVVGGATPIGDIRGAGTGYKAGVALTDVSLDRNQSYRAAYYAVYEGAGSSLTGKVGIGTTAGDFTDYGYYDGVFTTKEVHDFDNFFSGDTGDLAATTTGSGIYMSSDVTLEFEIMNPMGEQLNTSAQIVADPFISGQEISILNADGSMRFPRFRNYDGSSVTIDRRANKDIFGQYTNNYAVRNTVVSYDGTRNINDYFVYTNPAEVAKVRVQDGSGTWLNESDKELEGPPTGDIGSFEDAKEALRYHNHQPVYDSDGNSEAVSGKIEFTLSMLQKPSRCTYGDLLIFAGDNALFSTNEGSLVGKFPLEQIQEGQTITLYEGNGIPVDEPRYYAMMIDSPVGFDNNAAGSGAPVYFLGDYTLAQVPLPNMNFMPNKGNAQLEGDIVVKRAHNGEGGYVTADCIEIGPEDYTYPYAIKTHEGHVGIGTSAAMLGGARMSVNGNLVGGGTAGRATGPGGVDYALASDVPSTITFGISAGDVTKVGAGGLSDDDFVRVNGTTYEGRSASDVRSDLSLGSLALLSAVDADSVTVSNLEVDNFKDSAIVTESEGISSHDNDTSLPTSAAVKDYVDNTVIPDTNTYVTSAAFGTSDGVLTLTRNDAATVTVDLDGRYQDEITSSNRLNANLISAGNVSNTEFDYLDGVTSAIQTQLDGKQATLTFGIASDNVLQSNGTMADNEFLKVDGTKIEGRSTSEVKTDLSLNNVENTALSTWAGSSNITTVGSITAGEWAGTAIADAYISSASTWNAKQDAITASNRLNANLVSAGSVSNTEFDYLDGVTSAIQTQLDSKQATLTFGIADTNAVKIDGSPSDDQYVRFTANGIEGRSASNVRSDLSLGSLATLSAVDADSVTVSNLEVDNFKAATIVTESDGIASNDNDTTIPTSAAVKDYVDSNDGNIYVSSAAFGTDDGVLTLTRTDSATVTVDLDGRYQDDITTSNRLNANLIGSDGNVSNTEFGYLNGVTSAIQTQLDAKQASLTFGISNTNAVKIDSASVADDQYARFTSNGLEDAPQAM